MGVVPGITKQYGAKSGDEDGAGDQVQLGNRTQIALLAHDAGLA